MPSVVLADPATPQNLEANSGAKNLIWREIEPGYAIGRYQIGTANLVLKTEVFLVRFDPSYFTFHPVSASDFGHPQSDLLSMSKQFSAVAGINANFFDEKGEALGLIVADSQMKKRMHRGGKLLTGIFLIQNGKPKIVNRFRFKLTDVTSAIQAGPRLIVNKRTLKVSSALGSSRRSGIAVTSRGEVILYATLLRFPGASLKEIQQMLLDPALDVTDALNLDGGGSSQLFIEKNQATADDTFISGGDEVPVALLVKKKR